MAFPTELAVWKMEHVVQIGIQQHTELWHGACGAARYERTYTRRNCSRCNVAVAGWLRVSGSRVHTAGAHRLFASTQVLPVFSVRAHVHGTGR